MSEFTVECESDGEIATLTLTEGFAFPKWKCNGGSAVWGSIFQGSLLSATVDGDLELTGTAIINNWKQVSIGSTGDGSKLQDTGSFPATDFTWKCIDKS